MYIKNYELFEDKVYLTLADNTTFTVHFDSKSGQIHAVHKNGPGLRIQHTGICLGTSRDGTPYHLHNHIKARQPEVVTLADFSQGQQIFIYPGIATNSPMETIRIGLQQLLTGKPYSLLNYNCQGFVNEARQNRNRSEDVENIIGGIAFIAVAGFALNLLLNPKTQSYGKKRQTRRRASKW